MGVRSWRAAASLAGLAVAVGATGCTSKAKPIIPAPVVSQTSSSAAPTLAPTPTVAAASTSASVSASPSGPVLPAGCSQLLPLGTLESILGFGILGQVNYLKAAPVPQSGRTGRVTCTYGTAPGAPIVAPTGTPSASGAKPTASPTPVPLVQVSYITYIDASTAAGRVQTTIEADGTTAAVSNVSVSGKAAFVLIGPTSSELVMSDLARTIVVELSPTLVTSDKAPAALEAIAAVMLRFGAAPSGSASPSAGGSA
ncbi:MAG TPA: hypothetical protein VIJ96_12430 [Acidothermaceae bacterium]